jgi:hypothetical protein
MLGWPFQEQSIIPMLARTRSLVSPKIQFLILGVAIEGGASEDYQKRGLQESRQANEFTSVVRAEWDDLELIMAVGGNWSGEPY